MNGKTNAKSGAGAIRNGCAILEVRALAGSQIVASRSDGLIKKQNKGYFDFSDERYQFFYIILQQFELSNQEWTVTATSGAAVASTTVIINQSKRYPIGLFQFYNNGNLCGYPWLINKHSNTYTEPTGNTLTCSGSKSDAYVCNGFFINQLVNVTDMREISCHVVQYTNGQTLQIFLTSAVATSNTLYSYMVTNPGARVAFVDAGKSPITDAIITLDVSSLMGAYYINIGARASTLNSACTITVDEVWSE